jgi:ABC-type glycerol-3-phosphate transport system substrate-binding protein
VWLPGCLAGLLVSATLAECGAGASAAAPNRSCPLQALNPHHPLTVTIWESYDRIEDAAIRSLADAFNLTHPAVHVMVDHSAPVGVDPTGYQENGAVMKQFLGHVLGGGPVPDIVETPQAPATRVLIDSGGIVAAQVCIDATHTDLSDFLPQTLAESKVGATQWGMPDGYDPIVGFYDLPTLVRAGLDPTHLPETLTELLSAAKTLVAHGVGDPITTLSAVTVVTLSGVHVTDRNDGHAGRPTHAAFNTPTARLAVGMISQLGAISGQQAVSLPPGPQILNPALGQFATGQGAYTDIYLDPTGLKEVVLPALAEGQAPNVQLTVGPVPSLTGPGGTGTWSSNWFLAKTSPLRRAAAWEFLDWFEQPAQQARWHELTGYFPDRISAAHDPTVVALWRQQPLLAQIWNLATTRPWAVFPVEDGWGDVGNIPPSPAGVAAPGFEAAFMATVHATDAGITAYYADPVVAIRCYGSQPSPRCPANGAPPAP